MLEVSHNERSGPVIPLHGVNLGPIERHWARDYTEPFRAAGIPSVRVHDASLFVAEVVDLHCIFPDPTADPEDPGSYRFTLTDEYLKSIVDTGAEIYLRIGESIEHWPKKIYIHPELWDPQALARVAVNFVRHVNEGWADGHHWNIRYVEFWNEPDNRWRDERERRICWSGSPDEYVHYYDIVAKAVKNHDPSLKVGLAGFTVRWTRDWLAADADDLDAIGGWAGVPARCKQTGAPVDFLSWHFYGETWDELISMSRGVRQRLDDIGLPNAENHLTEWHYVPKMRDEKGEFTFTSVRLTDDYDRIERAMDVTSGRAAGGFTFGALCRLQDASMDVAHHYTGIAGNWGLFQFSGRPNGLYGAIFAFNRFVGPEGAVRLSTMLDKDLDEAVSTIAIETKDGETLIGIGAVSALDGPLSIMLPDTTLPAEVRVDSLGDSATWTTDEVAVTDNNSLSLPIPEPGIYIVRFRAEAEVPHR